MQLSSQLASGAVIAGGRSTRMGTDKRALLIDGIPMLRRAVAAVAAVTDDVLVACPSGNLPDASLLEGTGARLVYDRIENGGPLAGVDAVLGAADRALVLVVAADMPWLEPGVLRLLIGRAAAHPAVGAVALATERGPEPLLAVYRRTHAAPAVRQLLGSGVRRMHALLDALDLETVGLETWKAIDPDGQSGRNVNCPEDLALHR